MLGIGLRVVRISIREETRRGVREVGGIVRIRISMFSPEALGSIKMKMVIAIQFHLGD